MNFWRNRRPGGGSRGRWFWLVCLWALLAAPLVWADPASLRVGYQKATISLILAKENGLLERRFPGTKVQWLEFPAGPQMLEALNVGSLDLAATGDTPPIYAQAAGGDLVYVGVEPAMPRGEALVVAADSPIHSVIALKGKRIALQKGSSSHSLLLRLLGRAGLSIADVRPVYLPPADARAAFESGQVDAWAIWDPYYSSILLTRKARLLADGEGLDLVGTFYLAARSYAENNADFVRQVLDEISHAEALTRSATDRSVEQFARLTGLPKDVVALSFQHRVPAPISPVSPAVLKAQQHTADLFFDSRLLPRRVKVADVVWSHQP